MATGPDETEIPLTNSGKQIRLENRQNEKDNLQETSEEWRLLEIFMAEFLGTALLLFFGCMSSLVWSESAEIHPWAGSVVFAVTVTTIIQMIGHISAAHLNPAVTVCFYILGHITALQALVYFVAEVLGSILGFGLLKFITPCDIYEMSMQYSGDKLCVTYPHESVTDLQAFLAEFLATSLLVLVVCSVVDGRNKGDSSVPLKFGATILLLCIAEGPFTGASMNPSRSLSPVIWTGAWDKHWIYWIAPLSGGFFATIFYVKLFSEKITQKTSLPGKNELKIVTSS